MLPNWLRHMFRDRIGEAASAPLRGPVYLIDLDGGTGGLTTLTDLPGGLRPKRGLYLIDGDAS